MEQHTDKESKDQSRSRSWGILCTSFVNVKSGKNTVHQQINKINVDTTKNLVEQIPSRSLTVHPSKVTKTQ